MTTINQLAKELHGGDEGAIREAMVSYLGHLTSLTEDTELSAEDEQLLRDAFTGTPRLIWEPGGEHDYLVLFRGDEEVAHASIPASEEREPYEALEEGMLGASNAAAVAHWAGRVASRRDEGDAAVLDVVRREMDTYVAEATREAEESRQFLDSNRGSMPEGVRLTLEQGIWETEAIERLGRDILNILNA